MRRACPPPSRSRAPRPDKISHNVANAAQGSKVIVSILSDVASAATETRRSAQTVLSASDSVEAAAKSLRTEVETFLGKVSA